MLGLDIVKVRVLVVAYRHKLGVLVRIEAFILREVILQERLRPRPLAVFERA